MLFDTIDPNQEQFIELTYIVDILYYIVLFNHACRPVFYGIWRLQETK